MRQGKSIWTPGVTLALFLVAIGLLLGSSVGGARAALTYFSETYSSRVQMYDIGVTLQENGEDVSWRNYNSAANGTWDDNTGVLLGKMLKEGEELKIGVQYPEQLRVRNSGTINQYVRVTLYKYWLEESGTEENKTEKKLQDLSPDLIDLHLTNLNSDWLVDESASTAERTVLYYRHLLNSGATSPIFADTLTIDGMIATKVTQTETKKNGYTTIVTSYDYNGRKFQIEAHVDAVQEHNAQDAIWSAWGRRVSVRNNTLSLQ